MEYRVENYNGDLREKWDKFVNCESANGTFLQTRQFLEYHGDRFMDHSLIVYKGNNTIAAVVPACVVLDVEDKIFSAHMGSTFGGIVLDRQCNNIEDVEAVINCLEDYFAAEGYREIQLKYTSEIFAKDNCNLLDYFMFQKGYSEYKELSCYIDFTQYNDDIITNFSSGRRRDYKYSLKSDLVFQKIGNDTEVERFYHILCENLQKFDAVPVHSLSELLDFKNNRLPEITEFYGVYHGDEMIAGSMVFNFHNTVFHTQYLAAKQDYLKMYPMNFLDTNLICEAKNRGFRYFSFGTSTEEHGKVLNKHLAQFKEGFGTQFGINKRYVKRVEI